uniref:Helix-turn-helix DNA binding domain protein n=1 Tax=Mycolicibacterium phage Alyssa1 TaxID=3240801 RepID=A0AB39U1H6_9CAUD
MANRNLVQHHGERGAHAPGGGHLYAGIPMELARDGKLSYLARSVAMYVWSHDEKWQQSASSVADALSMDRGSVGKALAELQERGWLVREIHQTVGPSGKPRTAWERWHLQMTNRPFSSEEVSELSRPSDVRATPAPSDQTCGPHPHGGADDTRTGGADETRTIEMQFRNAPEVHSSNARTDQDETGLWSRSLADAARPEATPAYRPAAFTEDPFADPRPAWVAEAVAREERAWESQPATAGGLPACPWD